MDAVDRTGCLAGLALCLLACANRGYGQPQPTAKHATLEPSSAPACRDIGLDVVAEVVDEVRSKPPQMGVALDIHLCSSRDQPI